MKREILIISVLGAVLAAGFAFAQTTSTLPTATSAKEQLRLRAKELNKTRIELKKEQSEILQDIRQQRQTFRSEAKTLLQNYATSTPEERQQIRKEIREQHQEMKENISSLRKNLRENAQLLRENFREKIKNVKTRARIAAAHARGLRMINRYRAAVYRFSHILDRLESRMQKLKDRGVDVSSVEPLLEEARVMETEAEVKLEELKANYEDLLSGEKKISDIIGKGKTIAKELRDEIAKLHAKLKEIVLAIAKLEKPETTSTNIPSESSPGAPTSENNND